MLYIYSKTGLVCQCFWGHHMLMGLSGGIQIPVPVYLFIFVDTGNKKISSRRRTGGDLVYWHRNPPKKQVYCSQNRDYNKQ